MKKSLLTFVIFLLVQLTSFAQQTVLSLEEIDDVSIHDGVVEEIKDNFEDFYIEHIYVIPLNYIEEEYKVVYNRAPLQSLFTNTYEVDVITDNGKEKYFLDQYGNIVMAKANLESEDLPKDILDYLGTSFDDWKVIQTAESIISSRENNKDVYEVFVVNGDYQKTLFFKADGNLIFTKEH